MPQDPAHDGWRCIAEWPGSFQSFWLLQDREGNLAVEWDLAWEGSMSTLVSMNIGEQDGRQQAFLWASSAGMWRVPDKVSGQTWLRLDGHAFRPEGLERVGLTEDDVTLRVTSFDGSPFVLWVFDDGEESYFRSYGAYASQTPEGPAYHPDTFGVQGEDGRGTYRINLWAEQVRVQPVLEYVDIPAPREPSLLDERACDHWPGHGPTLPPRRV